MDRLIPVTFAQLHGPLFSAGVNMGDKINAAQRGAKLLLDTELGGLWMYFKGKTTLIPFGNVASVDAAVSVDVLKELGFFAPSPAVKSDDQQQGPPAVRRGRPPKALSGDLVEDLPDPSQPYDPNDESAASAHRAAVRAASANANRAPNVLTAQGDDLIQQSRATAMGMKHQKSAQVATAHQVGELASVTGKKKVISHAEPKAQAVKDPNA